MSKRINFLVVVSDLHCGCRLGLCPAGVVLPSRQSSAPPRASGKGGVPLDDGGPYLLSKLQRKVLRWWDEFWDEWVPGVTRGEPYAVAVNGDSLDGNHHGSTTQISHNLSDQALIGEAILRPRVEACEGRFYMLRGTEAHVGPSGSEEERLARSLGAVPDEHGRSARYDLWVRVGRGLAHLTHHIGVTGSMHYESTAVMKELTESYAEAGRWHKEPPDVVVRSHRHRCVEVRVPTSLGYGISFCTAGWQLKTPFTFRGSGRLTQPQIGGSVVCQGDHDLYTRHRIWGMDRPQEVVL